MFKLELQFYGSTPWLLEIIDGQLVSIMHDVLEKLINKQYMKPQMVIKRCICILSRKRTH
jgi:hypothetical protein